ncbi:hypothetical protein K7W42_19705 [Deinococcus sp. HMF7604]|uniref:hypothetical protein n=1 Tax=Deinococcus betulae TaxID=2873312 RepID=UPI001CD01A00|nr:hypothetical protein [Deinococcus betulae]MBZ9753067.1 hypothetical protein [Deinococcus betulae]
MVLAFRLLGAEQLPLSRRAAQAVPGGLVLALTLVLFMAWWRSGDRFWEVARQAIVAGASGLVLVGLLKLGVSPVRPIALFVVVWALRERLRA